MQYFYLIWVLIFFLIWVVVFFWRKDTRKEMLIISTLFGWGGVVSEKVYIADWWQPLTITGTRIGIEDFMVGFCIGGIAAVIYEEIYYQHLVIYRSKISYNHWLPFFGLPALFLGLFYIAKVNSFYSTMIALKTIRDISLCQSPS